MTSAAALSLRVPAEAAQMAMVRAELAAYARRAGMAASGVEDAQTIVTEACGNSIKHAYDGSGDGYMEINATVEAGKLHLTVRDFGSGVGPYPVTASPSLHAGMAIIGALSERFQLSSRRGGGTKLEACLSLNSPDERLGMLT